MAHSRKPTANNTLFGQPWPIQYLLFAVLFGLGSGLVELVLLALRKYGLGRILRVSRDVIWMAPLADMAICLGVAALLVVLAVAIRPLRSPAAAITGTAFPAYLTVLLQYRGIHVAAEILLAFGLAVQTSRLLIRFPGITGMLFGVIAWRRFRPLSTSVKESGEAVRDCEMDRRRFLLGSAGTVVGLAALTRGWRVLHERREAPRTAALARTNVLLIVLDTVRASDLSLYGYERRTTPRLERLARESVVFDRAYAPAPWTLPSHATMFTGRWPHELSADWDVPLDNAFPTIAETLGAAGWATAGFVANSFYGGWEHGLDRGFAHYDDYPVSASQILASSALGSYVGCGDQNALGCRLRDPLRWNELLGRKRASRVREEFLAWLDHRDGTRPFFAFLNFFDAHRPYLPPPPYDTMFGSTVQRKNPMHLERPGWTWTPEQVAAEQAAYDGAIASMDEELGRMLDTLEARGLLSDTLVIVTSDHGEEFFEHGTMTHGNSLYVPSLQVPLLLMCRGRVPAGTRIEAPVSLRDVPATILDLVGMDASRFPGRSLAASWRPGGAPSSPALLAEVSGRTFRPPGYPVRHGDMNSIMTDQWHFIRRGDGKTELYDVASDPWETRDRAAQERTVADSLDALLRRLTNRHK